jgi:hypothetical protein
MASKPNLRQLMKFVYYLLSFRISLLHMDTKPDLHHIMKFVYLLQYSESVLNIGPKHGTRQPTNFVYWRSTYDQSVEYGFET